MHLLLSSFVDGRQLNLLVATDIASGEVLVGRDLFLEVREVSRAGIGPSPPGCSRVPTAG